MAEKGIIFSPEMVRAIQDNRKSQTRRVIKPQPLPGQTRYNGESWEIHLGYPLGHGVPKLRYNIGDYLYVRETWAPCATIDSWLDNVNLYVYKADYNQPVPWRWRSPRYMPKNAARIWLHVTDTWTERLQEITPAEVIAEGITDPICAACYEENGGCYPQLGEDRFCGNEEYIIDLYAILWDYLNDKRGFDWDSDPYVQVVVFERCEKPNG